jgi:hypothetical protein
MRKLGIALSLLAGVVAIVLAIIMHATHPHLGHTWVLPWSWLNSTKAFTASGTLGGMGIFMIVGGLIMTKWEAIGGIIPILASVYGLAYTFQHQYTRIPLLHWWAAPMILSWLAGICAGYALYGNTAQYGSPERPIEAPRP